MTIQLLKQVIREMILVEKTLLSADDIEKERMPHFIAPDRKESFLKIMRQWNLQIIPTAKKTPGLLGTGVNGMVFDVVRDGKRYAMKMTEHYDDAKMYRYIMQIRDNLPQVAKSALPHVYEQSEMIGGHYFTLMEILVPTPESLQLSSFPNDDGYSGISRGTIAKLNKPFVEKLDNILKRAVGADIAKRVFQYEEWTSLKNNIANGEVWPSNNHDKMFIDGKSAFYECFQSIFADNPELKKQCYDKGFAPWTFGDVIVPKWKRIIGVTSTDARTFPEFADEDKNNVEDPRLQYLLKGLRWLKKHDYLVWGDLHSDNVMMRPSTNELVAADVGNFTRL